MAVLAEITGFEWNAGNRDTSWEKHQVTTGECEEVFFNEPYLVSEDAGHSESEQRYYLLGITNAVRRLFVVFTIRQKKIRVISARDMNRKERAIYEAIEKDTNLPQ